MLFQSDQRAVQPDIHGGVGKAIGALGACWVVSKGSGPRRGVGIVPWNQVNKDVIWRGFLLPHWRHQPFRNRVHVLDTRPNEVLEDH
jgi:hypothetical protein